MAVYTTKPDKYAKCICCGRTDCLTEYQFSNDNSFKTCITLCCKCVADMYMKSVSHEEVENDKRPENN